MNTGKTQTIAICMPDRGLSRPCFAPGPSASPFTLSAILPRRRGHAVSTSYALLERSLEKQKRATPPLSISSALLRKKHRGGGGTRLFQNPRRPQHPKLPCGLCYHELSAKNNLLFRSNR